MASPIPNFKTLIRIDEFRDLVLSHFQKEIDEGELYDSRDIQRFKEIDEYTTMFLQHGQFAAEFDRDRALRIFNASMSWRKKHNVYDISPNDFPRNYFDRNAIFFKNCDINNYPLLHFVVRTFVKGQEDNEAVKRFITYHFERHVRRNPGQRLVVLFDMSETGLKHLDYDLVKFIIGCAQIYYPGLLGYMLIFKLPFILNAAWRIIRGWLPPESEQFIKFVDAKDICQYVRTDQLSVSMGGTDSTRYVHQHDPVHEAVDDPMNASVKKKVTFADAGGTADFQSTSSPTDSAPINELVNRHETSTLNSDTTTYEDLNHSVTSHSESSQYVPRKSILQKSIHTNGNLGEEKVLHGLAIRPYDELIFERADSSTASSNADSIQTLILTNMGDKILTFKIKTTSPEKFRVKPGCSLLHPGASATVSVYLLKAHCTPNSVISKEKFLIIWTLIGQEMKQPQLTEFWKTVPSSVLYEHRLKCSFATKSPSHTSMTTSPTENAPHLRLSSTTDPSFNELQKLVKDSITLQQTIQRQTAEELATIRKYMLIILQVVILIFLWNIFQIFVSIRSSSSNATKSDL